MSLFISLFHSSICGFGGLGLWVSNNLLAWVSRISLILLVIPPLSFSKWFRGLLSMLASSFIISFMKLHRLVWSGSELILFIFLSCSFRLSLNSNILSFLFAVFSCARRSSAIGRCLLVIYLLFMFLFSLLIFEKY